MLLSCLFFLQREFGVIYDKVELFKLVCETHLWQTLKAVESVLSHFLYSPVTISKEKSLCQLCTWVNGDGLHMSFNLCAAARGTENLFSNTES